MDGASPGGTWAARSSSSGRPGAGAEAEAPAVTVKVWVLTLAAGEGGDAPTVRDVLANSSAGGGSGGASPRANSSHTPPKANAATA